MIENPEFWLQCRQLSKLAGIFFTVMTGTLVAYGLCCIYEMFTEKSVWDNDNNA